MKTLKDRIKKRGRSEEAHIELGFLEGLQEYHENWLFYQVTSSQTSSFMWPSINDVTTNWEGVKGVVTFSVEREEGNKYLNMCDVHGRPQNKFLGLANYFSRLRVYF